MKSVKSPKTAAPKTVKRAPKQTAASLTNEADQLILENIMALTRELQALSKAVDDHVQKTASIANHVIAMESVLAEVVSLTGLDMVKVNNRIRAKVATASAQPGASNMAIDIAASIASPVPRI